MRNWLTRTVLLLSFVSLLNDMSSELLYPVLPLYMAGIGYGAFWIGVLEGVAEATAGLTKGWFGEWSDKTGRRLPFVRFGYSLSALCKAFLPLFANAFWAVTMRAGDKVGKGFRTGARDAMLADESEGKNRGKVFGLHRAMDTAGAVFGPMMAFAWIWFFGDSNYVPLFYWSLLPGGLAILLLFLIRDGKRKAKEGKHVSLFSSFGYWKKSTKQYRKLVSVISFFTFFNSSDMFILLLAGKIVKEQHYFLPFNSNQGLITVLLYIFYNLVYSLFSYPSGSLSDKFGHGKMLRFGYTFFAIAYGILALFAVHVIDNIYILPVAFVFYGLYSAFTEGNSRAWISTVCNEGDKGVALGLFAGISSIAALGASVLAGIAWEGLGAGIVFILPACAAFISVIFLTFGFKAPGKDSVEMIRQPEHEDRS
ncbi:MAG TPA: MFS transporter [Bacteroidia bacterium]|nr:MFS transporter [Bacteroidia bacterium]